VVDVVEDGSVRARADDRGVSRSGGTAAFEDQFYQCFDFILFHSRSCGFHCFAMSFGSYVGSALHQLNLVIALEYAHLVDDRRGIDNCLWWMNRFAVECPHPSDLPDDGVVKVGIYTEPVIEFVRAVEYVV